LKKDVQCEMCVLFVFALNEKQQQRQRSASERVGVMGCMKREKATKT
jgi:hypothetical protein